jgi:CheY-like chemotaxis protein/pSer/pThr/pTyr-binding forkhead associated (FHA) protein
MPVLRIKLPDNKGEITHVLAGDRITIGRRPENTIQIIDRTVSAHHAELISANGHYRLHDLGSTNLTCVDGQPITDFHLHEACKVSFGTVECEYSPETPVTTAEKAEVVPTRAELEFLRRENLDLQAKIAAMQKQIDILSSARLMTKDTQQLGIMPEVHRRVQQDRDELRRDNANLKQDVQNLREDITALTKERDALRLAWDSAKQERDEFRAQLSAGGRAASDSGAPAPLAEPPPASSIGSGNSTEPSPSSTPEPPKLGQESSKGAPDHRALASVLTKAPAALKAMRTALDALQTSTNPAEATEELCIRSTALADAFEPVMGHPVQRLASACAALVKNSRNRRWTSEGTAARTLAQAAEVIGGLLDPRVFKRAAESEMARAVVIDDDPDLLETVTHALKTVEIRALSSANSSDALSLLQKQSCDLVLLDVGLPDISGIELCEKVREIPDHRQTPIVFITVENSVDARAQASLNGGDDFIAKPFDVLELVIKASTWVCRSKFGLKA